jgi:hypothetical protein
VYTTPTSPLTYLRLKSTPSRTSFLLQKSNYAYSNPNPQPQPYKPRPLSKVGSDSYNRSLRRAFSRAKLLAFFNPDLTQFITLTYKHNIQDPNKAIQDIKNLITYQTTLQHTPKSTKKDNNLHEHDGSPDLSSPRRHETKRPIDEREAREQSEQTPREVNSSENVRNKRDFKYIYVFELQKRGAIHVHMIANEWLQLEKKNGHVNVKGWSHGFSEVLTIRNFDNSFRPYLYLFKYMKKAQRVGKSFIHVSRNFDKIADIDYDSYIAKLDREHILFKEDHQFEINDKLHTITKEYYRRPQSGIQDKEKQLWQIPKTN